MPPGARSILVALIVVASGCAGGSAATVVPTTAGPTSTSAPRATEVPITPAPTTDVPVAAPEFAASAEAVTAADLGSTWREGCPVGPASLRRLTLAYWGFDDAAHMGTLVINADVADSVTEAFRTLYEGRFPIRQMVPVDAYGGSDDASLAADNTAGFNCRAAVAAGPPTWSQHAYGLAIDVDPLENPSVLDGQTYPPEGAAFLDRTDLRPGMATADGPLVQAFAAIGWGWGGVWRNVDYQHFSRSGT